MTEKEICFDMDGTFVDFYSVKNWLADLKDFNVRPYKVAKPMVNMSVFAKQLNKAQHKGYKIKIISWGSKAHNPQFDELVKKAKLEWLNIHLPSVTFDEIHILPHGTPKESYGNGYLFDDEKRNRENWNGVAFAEKGLLDNLKNIINGEIE